MKKVIASLVLFGASKLAFAGCIGPVIMGECQGTITPFNTGNTRSAGGNGFVPNVFGPGVHQNQYGQAVTLHPQGGGIAGERLDISPDAYGPGIHRDQYGRVVRERPWQ